MATSNPTTVLLTGATGLLGSYLLAGLLRRRIPVAVFARGNAHGTAGQRIEAVVQQFESDSLLPRPRIIPATLEVSGCGLSQADQQWLRQRPLQLIHAAASIRFDFDRETGEPYRSNVQGLKHLLHACRSWHVSDFHFISTAYVGSQQSGPVLELPIDEEQIGANDYERSKIEAEALVRACRELGKVSIHRPSIIVGDSSSGFTSTFHGFYAPLKIGAQLAQTVGFSKDGAAWLRNQLGLKAEHTKNLVTVDWVAECILQTSLEGRSSAASKSRAPGERDSRESQHARDLEVFHWTNPRPVKVVVMQNAISDSLEEKFGDSRSAEAPQTPVLDELAEGVREQLRVYRSYFGGDPEFDGRSARGATPSLPCPEVDYPLLRKLCRFALDRNFGWPRPPLPAENNDPLAATLRNLATAEDSRADRPEGHWLRMQLVLLGPGAPEPLVVERFVDRATIADCSNGANMVVSMPLTVFKGCMASKGRLDSMFQQGKALVWGPAVPSAWLAILEDWIEEVRVRHAF